MDKKNLTIILITALTLQVLSNAWSSSSSLGTTSAQSTVEFGDSIYNGTFDIEPKSKENFTIDFEGILEYNTSSQYTGIDFYLPKVDFGDFWIVLLRNESEVIYDSPLDYSNLTTGWWSLVIIMHVLLPSPSYPYNITVVGANYGFRKGLVDENPYIFTCVFYNNNSYSLSYPFEIRIVDETPTLLSSSEDMSVTSSNTNTTSDVVISATSSSINVLFNPLVVLVLAVVGVRFRRYKRPQS